MKYIPQSPEDRKDILNALGLEAAEDVFSEIPKHLRLAHNFDYPTAQSEMELRKTFDQIESLSPSPELSFAGCGIYPHDVPSIVGFLQSRSEFATAYTPYQPEVSQGLLQCIFEYQTLACQLTEMELSNASLYDGATSLGEALLMGLRIKKKSEGKILVSELLHPHYEEVLRTYCEAFLDRMEIIPSLNGRLDLQALASRLEKNDVDFLITQSPNIFGGIESYSKIGKLVKDHNIFWISSTMEPLSFGMTRGPGFYGAHIATAEGQSFGNHAYLGGSSFGIFCTRNEFLRNLPGRLVGESIDEEERRAFTLTFATREQFIRRGRATSNICTNNNLNMLAGLIHLATLGKNGVKELAEINFSKTEYLKGALREIKSVEIDDAPTFNEFCLVIKNKTASDLLKKSASENWICGVDLGRFKDKWKQRLLIHTSELHSKDQLDRLIRFIRQEA
ncbi:MAG: aminomethyl-transferring glycine dehydrogenase subunit GcvPA [Bdellovibrionota bacterium]